MIVLLAKEPIAISDSSERERKTRNRTKYALPWLAFLLFSLPAWAGELTGKVVAVIDGDTVEVLDAERTVHRVRLAGIDAPERGQAFGKRAKHALLARVAGKPVTVDWHKRDRYRRIVGKLVHDGRDANLAMVAPD